MKEFITNAFVHAKTGSYYLDIFAKLFTTVRNLIDKRNSQRSESIHCIRISSDVRRSRT